MLNQHFNIMGEKEILYDYGWCQVLRDKENYFLKYNGGGIAIEMVIIQVSKSEAEIA